MKPKALNLTMTALFAVIICICSMLSIPAAIPFTMQTFAVFLALFMLGGKYGTLSIAVYILLGITGLPVFHNFTGGIGILMGSTGGFILGFILCGAVYLLMTRPISKKPFFKLISAFAGLVICYITGTLWFVFTSSQGAGFGTALLTCVVPFIVPDAVKILLAYFISQRLNKVTHLNAN